MRLISLVDSPHEIVRCAARGCLSEFSFRRYLAAFDLLGSDARQGTGLLVKKIDPQSLPLLMIEMGSKSRTRRLRALSMAAVMDFARDTEARILELLDDEDHFVRAAAATALSRCDTPTARAALRRALLDRSVKVQEAAERGLEALDADPPADDTVKISQAVSIPDPPPQDIESLACASDDEDSGQWEK